VARTMPIDYREDDGAAARALALARLAIRHPVRSLSDAMHDQGDGPSLLALAPGALRLGRDRGARVQALGGQHAHSTARRLARLAGCPLYGPRRS
jgi:hypothetical protein